MITPNQTLHSNLKKEFKIQFISNTGFSTGSDMAVFLKNTINNYYDMSSNSYPFYGSNVTFNPGQTIQFILVLKMSYIIDQKSYSLILYSSQTNHFWKTTLDFSNNTSTIGNGNITFDMYTNNTLTNDKKINYNQINIIDGSNNTFNINLSLSNIDIREDNPIIISIPPGNYSVIELTDKINSIFDSNALTNGSRVSLITMNGDTYTKFRFNINNVFTTKDYRLVFYDPYSFTSCFSNNSKKTSTSLQNTTWDTTLGWLLGYRNAIYYNLSEPVIADQDTTKLVYYLTDSSNVCVLNGDTTKNTLERSLTLCLSGTNPESLDLK